MLIFTFRLLIILSLVIIIAFIVIIKAFKIFSELSTMRIILLTTLIYLVVVWHYTEVVYAESFTSEMDRGAIARTPLLQPGQNFADLEPGLHRVTGGYVNVGFLSQGTVKKVTGVLVDNYPQTLAGWNYQHGNLPFNKNFAKVLYELWAANKKTCSYTSLDYAYSGRDLAQANLNSQYLQGFKTAQGLGVGSKNYGELSITKKILNALAEQEN